MLSFVANLREARAGLRLRVGLGACALVAVLACDRQPAAPVALRLERPGGACHAFCAGPGAAWTAAHCVDGVASLTLRDEDGRVHAVAEVVEDAVGNASAGDVTRRARDDRARLRLRGDGPCQAEVAFARASRGEVVRLVRYRAPAREGSVRRRGSGLLVTTPLVCAGDSGAPLVNERGEVVGLAVGRVDEGCETGPSFFAELP